MKENVRDRNRKSFSRKIFTFGRKLVAVDLGTANTVVYVDGRGIVLQEPSVLALDKNGKLVAVGKEAKPMLGRTPNNIRVERPLHDGVVADFEATRAMMQYFMKRANVSGLIGLRPRVLISVPSIATQVERKAIEEAAIQAGADQRVHLIEEAIAAAIGVGLDIAEPRGHMVVDIGGGTTDVAIISCGGIASGRVIKVAGDTMDRAIVRFMRQKYNLIIGLRMAEMIKIQLGCAVEPSEDELRTVEVSGRDAATGLPERRILTSAEVYHALQPPLAEIIRAIRETLERCPPELLLDICEDGIVLTGGIALLPGIDRRISTETSLPVFVADNALTAVAEGTGRALKYVTNSNMMATWQNRGQTAPAPGLLN